LTTSHHAFKPRDVKSSKISLITWVPFTASSVLYTSVVLNIILFKMIYFCKVQGKNEKAYNHLILFVNQAPYDKVRRHLPTISEKSGCFNCLEAQLLLP
jgi:glycopeptide antibiotics resistance protein